MKLLFIFCKIAGHSWGITYMTQLFPPVWGNFDDRKKWLEEMQNRKCGVCGLSIKEISDKEF